MAFTQQDFIAHLRQAPTDPEREIEELQHLRTEALRNTFSPETISQDNLSELPSPL